MGPSHVPELEKHEVAVDDASAGVRLDRVLASALPGFSRMRVKALIQGDELRVTGKKRDDLQGVIAYLKSEQYGVPLQFINMRD